ncbi:hypothetical protein M0804_009846 [Polistes exclamans]|nr:hypothetical protein M0804_009846 [Polistes exclamans]
MLKREREREYGIVDDIPFVEVRENGLRHPGWNAFQDSVTVTMERIGLDPMLVLHVRLWLHPMVVVFSFHVVR